MIGAGRRERTCFSDAVDLLDCALAHSQSGALEAHVGIGGVRGPDAPAGVHPRHAAVLVLEVVGACTRPQTLLYCVTSIFVTPDMDVTGETGLHCTVYFHSWIVSKLRPQQDVLVDAAGVCYKETHW